MKRRNLIFNPIFLISLVILLLNDFHLKHTYSNELTGKLSDFTGLIVFPVFIAYLVPSSKKWISIATGILFIIWKTPIVTPAIELFNSTIPFQIQRVIDYSDYWALLILPISHIIIQKINNEKRHHTTFILQLSKVSIVLITLFAICATSRIPRAEIPKGTIHIGESYKIKKTKEETIEMIKSLGYNVDYYRNPEDTTIYMFKQPYYQTDNIIIYDDNKKPIDTILNVRYNLYEVKKEDENKSEKETAIRVINVTLKNSESILKLNKLKHLRKQYKEILEKNMIEKMK